MRRLLVIALMTAGIGVVIVGMGARGDSGGGGDAAGRVDAIFDRTAALIPGQKVKVAGAPVGFVTDIELTADRKARVQMEVEEGFTPFHADARCIIRAEALIGEKFVQCDPGSAHARPLEGEDGEAPTVPLERNTVPVEIDTILSTFRRPVRERFRILLSEFGIGLAGRSDDLDATIRRANPALREANELLRVLAQERDTLGELIEGSDAALAELASRRDRVKSFIERANSVTEATASRRNDLSEAVRKAPALLKEAEPAARQLSSFAREATPIARKLREAAPAVNDVLEDVAPLSEVAVPTLVRLSRTAKIGRRTVRAALPVADRLKGVARELPDNVRRSTALVESLRDSGGIENLLSFFYYATAGAARFDSISHLLPAFLVGNNCFRYSTTDTADCEDNLGGAGAPAARARRRRRGPGPQSTDHSPQARDPRPQGGSPAPPAPAPAKPQDRLPLPDLPVQPEPDDESVQDLLDWLLGP
jgi:phospholipid/cholesterol/gamma-HCH transport system substrate-binding protein